MATVFGVMSTGSVSVDLTHEQWEDGSKIVVTVASDRVYLTPREARDLCDDLNHTLARLNTEGK